MPRIGSSFPSGVQRACSSVRSAADSTTSSRWRCRYRSSSSRSSSVGAAARGGSKSVMARGCHTSAWDDAGMLVHVDTDFGGDPDDACALAMLLGWPDVEIAGITTNLDDGGTRAGCVEHVLELAGRTDVPVVAGADRSDTTGERFASTWDDARYWPAPVRAAPGAGERAVDLLAASIERGATIVAIGAFTNLARLERSRPGSLAGARVVAMAGWIDPPPADWPQWGAAMDFNAQCDTRCGRGRGCGRRADARAPPGRDARDVACARSGPSRDGRAGGCPRRAPVGGVRRRRADGRARPRARRPSGRPRELPLGSGDGGGRGRLGRRRARRPDADDQGRRRGGAVRRRSRRSSDARGCARSTAPRSPICSSSGSPPIAR